MPKIYKYYGIIFLFYSREHKPVHIHGRKKGRESIAELIINDGVIIEIKIRAKKGKQPLIGKDKKEFINFVESKADDIKQKWIDFFVNHMTPEIEEYFEL